MILTDLTNLIDLNYKPNKPNENYERHFDLTRHVGPLGSNSYF